VFDKPNNLCISRLTSLVFADLLHAKTNRFHTKSQANFPFPLNKIPSWHIINQITLSPSPDINGLHHKSFRQYTNNTIQNAVCRKSGNINALYHWHRRLQLVNNNKENNNNNAKPVEIFSPKIGELQRKKK